MNTELKQPWNKIIFKGSMYNEDGHMRWNLVIYQDSPKEFSVDENTLTLSLAQLGRGKTLEKAFKDFIENEQKWYALKMSNAPYGY